MIFLFNNSIFIGVRLLVSFAGKYLACDYCASSLRDQTKEETASSCNHQLFNIHVPQTEPDLFGPAFVEVGTSDNIQGTFGVSLRFGLDQSLYSCSACKCALLFCFFFFWVWGTGIIIAKGTLSLRT